MNTSSDGAPATVYASSTLKSLLVVLGSALFVVFGAAMAVGALPVSAPKRIVGVISVLFFGLCGYIALRRLLPPGRPELELTAKGLTHRTQGFIAWTEIAEIRLVSVKRQRMIELVLHDPAAYLARVSWPVRLAAKGNMRLGYGPAFISTTTLRGSAEDVYAAILRHHPGQPV